MNSLPSIALTMTGVHVPMYQAIVPKTELLGGGLNTSNELTAVEVISLRTLSQKPTENITHPYIGV
jgi:hypothetical protein